ncbi:MAG: hypothetical protein ABIE42_06035 [Candidatus Eisenbacteria bacterium]
MPRTGTVFFTSVGSAQQLPRAKLLIESIHAHGGELARCPVWVLEQDPVGAPCGGLAGAGVQVFPVSAADSLGGYLFAGKVSACARAEELAADSVGSLVWLIPECLILKPPVLLELSDSIIAAVRPVHIRNVGLPAGSTPDAFWRGIFDAVGEPDPSFTVESFVESEHIRPYFNSAAFSVRPAAGLMRRWLELFEGMVNNAAFRAAACGDEWHRIFLHQAILSTLLATSVDRTGIRELPPDYGYPYNLHGSVPRERRAQALDDLVCAVYEQRTVDPASVTDIEIREPLRSWLGVKVGEAEGRTSREGGWEGSS